MTTEATPPQAVETLLKELMGARKAFRLYPASNPLAAEWLQRLHRAVEAALGQGPPLRLRVAQTGFEWDGGQLAPRDRTLEAFRFELATRKITEVTLTPGVEPGELRELIELLNDTGGDPAAAAARPAHGDPHRPRRLARPLWAGRGGRRRPPAATSSRRPSRRSWTRSATRSGR